MEIVRQEGEDEEGAGPFLRKVTTRAETQGKRKSFQADETANAETPKWASADRIYGCFVRCENEETQMTLRILARTTNRTTLLIMRWEERRRGIQIRAWLKTCSVGDAAI